MRPLTPLTASVVRRAARSSPAGSWTVQGDVALDLRHRGAHVREQELRCVVLEGLATPQQDAKQEKGMARLVRAEMHGCVWGQRECNVGNKKQSPLISEPMLGDTCEGSGVYIARPPLALAASQVRFIEKF